MTSHSNLVDALVRYLEVHGFERIHVAPGRKGTNITASCPFAGKEHESGGDLHPSWAILAETGQYNCFTCRRTGNLHDLARELGIPLFDVGTRATLTLEESFERIQRELHRKEPDAPATQIMNLPESFAFFDFHAENKALTWLTRDKGFRIDTLELFGIGYNRETKNPIFPITNDLGYIIGWQERNLRYPKRQPKYLFSHDMDKRNTLYNYHYSKEWAKRGGICVVVEAIMSVMALYEVGVAGISPLSAGLSKEQAAKLGVFESVTLCFDADIAGQVALAQAALGQHRGKKFIPPLLKGAPFEVFSVTPPTKIHRMRREDIRPMLETRQRIQL